MADEAFTGDPAGKRPGPMPPPYISRVALENYKSIARCDVPLNPLTFLIGPNGSGKSNFLDALRFTAEALRSSLGQALDARDGLQAVLCRAPGHVRAAGRPEHIAMALEMHLPRGGSARYIFAIAAPSPGAFRIAHEECIVDDGAPGMHPARFVREGDQVTSNYSLAPPVTARDRLYLVNASGVPRFEPVYELLTGMAFYNLEPKAMRMPRELERGAQLASDGGNIASVLRRLEQDDPRVKGHVQDYLAQIVPGMQRVNVQSLHPYLALLFRMEGADHTHPVDFPPSAISDGTLRALGVLTALFQTPPAGERAATLIGIEEPEAALHPGAAGVLLDALRDAGEDVQVIVTTHSPDILDDKEIESDAILVAQVREGVTQLGPIDEADRSLLRDRLYTVGELMRQGALQPDPGAEIASPLAPVAGAG